MSIPMLLDPGFSLSPRWQGDLEQFGRIANPSGTINVPIIDPYQVFPDPVVPWHDTEPQPTDTQDHTTGKAVTMSGETTITVIGNLTNDPELRFTPVSREFGKTEGIPVANFTIASTNRTFDSASKEWKDGDRLFLRATVWRETAENVAASLTKGSRVVVTGRLKPRSYETKTGEKRTVIELEVDEIGMSLRYTSATPTHIRGGHQATSSPIGQGAAQPGAEMAFNAEDYADDDPWFGKNANPAGGPSLPGATAKRGW